MAENKNKIQEALDKFRKDGKAYLSEEDKKLNFNDNLFPKPKDDNKQNKSNKN